MQIPEGACYNAYKESFECYVATPKTMSVQARESGEELTGFDTEGTWKRIFEMAPTACWQEPDWSNWSIERLTLHNLGEALGAKPDGPDGWTKEREEHAAVQRALLKWAVVPRLLLCPVTCRSRTKRKKEL